MKGLLIVAGLVIVIGGLLVLGRLNTGVRGQASIGGATGSKLAPDFSLAKLGGGTISLAEFRGKKPVVVDFWASWCPNCRRDMPNLNSYYKKYKDQIEVIGVNLQESESTVQDFITSRDIAFPIALDPSGQTSRAFGIQYTNTHFLINKEGNLIRQIPGDISESDIISLIEQDV